MKKYDLVKLSDEFLRKDKNNLNMADVGVVLKENGENLQVMFFNSYNKGDYAVVRLLKRDVLPFEEKPSEEFKKLVDKFSREIDYQKTSLNGVGFEEYSIVELIVSKPRYEKFGLKKGDKGVVAIDFAVKNEVLVDFSGLESVDKTNMGLVSISLDDLKKAE